MMIPFRRRQRAAEADTLILTPVARDAALQSAQDRAWKAEEALRAMTTRLNASVQREQEANAALGRSIGELEEIRDHARQLGAEVAALRALLVRAKGQHPPADRVCSACHDPMPWGTAHYCTRTSEYREDAA